jgi:hypothetical protein
MFLSGGGEMSSVWAIEDGEYSDYHVVGVFSSRENAELVLGHLDSGDIAEWDLDPGIDSLNAGLSRYYVHMLRDGTVRESRACKFEIEEYEHLNPDPRHQPTFGLRISVFAKDEAHAIKIANEKRTQAIAEGRWDLVATPPSSDS